MTEQQERKRHIRAFMQAHYTDERLAQLLAHAQDGKLGFISCCCFVGIATADHALRGGDESIGEHYGDAMEFVGAQEAEDSYNHLYRIGGRGLNWAETAERNSLRRRVLIAMIRTEMKRRAALAAPMEDSKPSQRVAEPAL